MHIKPLISKFTLNRIIVKNKPFAIVVLLPVLIWLIYAIFIQSPRYESTAVVNIQKNQQGLNLGGLGSILGVAENTVATASYVAVDYIKSYAMYQQLNQQMTLTKQLQSKNIDFISRLGSHPNQNTLLNYYKSLLTVVYDSTSQTIEIKMQGYSAQQSQLILERILVNTQIFVNNLDQQLTNQRITFGKKQVTIAQNELLNIEHQIVNFQNNRGMLDPKTEVGVIVGILANLQSQLVMEQTSLTDKQAYYQANSMAILQSRQKIDALKEQIEIQKQKLLGYEGANGANEKLNKVVAEFENLSMQAKIAVGDYAVSIQGLTMAKSEAIQQKQQVVIIQAPLLPDYKQYPRTWYNALILFVILSIVYSMVQMVVRIIMEHKY